MPTYADIYDYIGGVFDKGAGYLLDMQWHLEATGANFHESDHADWTSQAPPAIHFTPTIPGIFPSNQHREFHYRFIATPDPLVLNNPPYDADIPWRLWNTFPLDDVATVATITGSNVITSDFIVTSGITDFEYKEFNIQIAEGEVQIDANLFGDFAQGDFTLDIIGVVVLTIDQRPVDNTVTERWKWNTQVIAGWDSTEQRIRYSPAPIRSINATYDLDEDEIVDLEQRLYTSSVSTLAIPYWQYQFYLEADSPASSNEIFFTTSYTNIRVGDRLYIIDKINGGSVIVTVEAVFTDRVRITSNLPVTLLTGWTGCPLYSVFTQNPQINMDSVAGSFRVSGEVTDRGRLLTRESPDETLTLFNGIPVLDFKVLAGITEGFQVEFEDLSTAFGRRQRSIIWERPQLLRSVAFSVSRKKALTSYDHATLFFDQVAGRHKPFYMSSRLDDLKLDFNPPNGSSQLTVGGLSYANVYFANNSYKQLEVEYLDGTYEWFNVNTAEAQAGGTTLVTLANALPVDVATNTIIRISYLYRLRLGSDEVTVDHQNNRTTFAFSIRGTEQ